MKTKYSFSFKKETDRACVTIENRTTSELDLIWHIAKSISEMDRPLEVMASTITHYVSMFHTKFDHDCDIDEYEGYKKLVEAAEMIEKDSEDSDYF
jgi:hypothetical protein